MHEFGKYAGPAVLVITWVLAINELIVTIAALFTFVLDPIFSKDLTWLQMVLIMSATSFYLIILFLLIIGLYEKASVLILPHCILSVARASINVLFCVFTILRGQRSVTEIFWIIGSCLFTAAIAWIEWRCYKEIRSQSQPKIADSNKPFITNSSHNFPAILTADVKKGRR
uniref:Uncharacterized protein n=1 Tax=Plectus sambesii TaxID=2011161 RepID=A0A914X8K6_9BILA